MSYVLFISEEKIKNSTSLSGSVDMDFILPYIKTSQRMYIEPKLGTDLFEALQSKITAGTLSGTYQTLVDDYIMEALVHFSFYAALPFLRVRVSNNGVGIKTSENIQALTNEEYKDLRQEIINTAEFFLERMVRFIRHNTASLPEYSTSSGADLSPTKSAYYSGMNLETQKDRVKGLTLDDFLTPDLKKY
tara:strand:+ start:3054 stop:3623 length:570 start_codon:yes stop_codon:yes gene_type:complete